jgi:hypothetical protein
MVEEVGGSDENHHPPQVTDKLYVVLSTPCKDIYTRGLVKQYMDINEHEKLFTIILPNSYCIAIQHLTVAVGYSTISKIRTRIRKSKKNKKTQ